MSVWEAVTWDVARAGGLTAYLLLTLAVALGLALSLRLQSPRWPRIINSELHNFLTLLASIFTVVHVLAVWIDPFTHFGWSEVFLPLASTYRPFWMAFGIVGLYLGIAIFISTWLRPHIGYALWRRLHVLTLGVYGLVTVHGIATGSDTRTWWALGLYLSSLAIVGTLFVLRIRRRPEAQSATPASHAGMAQRRVAAAGMQAGARQAAPRVQRPNQPRPARYGAPPAAAPMRQSVDPRGLQMFQRLSRARQVAAGILGVGLLAVCMYAALHGAGGATAATPSPRIGDSFAVFQAAYGQPAKTDTDRGPTVGHVTLSGERFYADKARTIIVEVQPIQGVVKNLFGSGPAS